MKFTAQQIAALVQGEIEGDPSVKVSSFAKIEESREGDLCFLANAKYEEYLYHSKASVVIVNDVLQLKSKVDPTLIRVKDAYASFAILLKTYEDLLAGPPKAGKEEGSFVSDKATIDETAFIAAQSYISQGAKVGKRSQIYPGVFIGEHVQLGDDCIIYPGVTIYRNCIIGNHCIVHAGTVIGSDGFGFAFDNGSFNKIPQIGNVVIGDNVEIGANCTIDRATMGSTRILNGAKLDNLIQVAHNVVIGENTVIAAQAGISGSTKIGNHCMIGGQAGVVGHIILADGTKINAQSGVTRTVAEPQVSLTGSPAFEYRASLKSQVVYRQLPDLLKRLEVLENKLESLAGGENGSIQKK